MKKLVITAVIAVFAFGLIGCAEHAGGKATAPGQVKKATGVHPVTGKTK
ncbi:MAG: hypothetical protein AB7E96_01935 [Deferribacterales bacterium]